jgi:hypothetical protein
MPSGAHVLAEIGYKSRQLGSIELFRLNANIGRSRSQSQVFDLSELFHLVLFSFISILVFLVQLTSRSLAHDSMCATWNAYMYVLVDHAIVSTNSILNYVIV